MVTAAVATATVILPGGLGSAAQQSPPPSLKALVAQATQLSNQINTLSEQYDGLRIQLAQARSEEQTAVQTAARDMTALGASQAQVGALAAESYMNGSVDPTLQLITSSDPQVLVSRASIMQQLDAEKGAEVRSLATAINTARRARQTARQQAQVVNRLAQQVHLKTAAIQARVDKLNGAAYQQAMAIFQHTGNYPVINIPGGNTIGAEALRYALGKQGDPYVWGAAGPGAFDCSGLVMWAYAQVGIHLDHFTGDQWNEGEHISRSQLEPGDLVFFFADISHVGLYIGNGLMVDAPSWGQPVQVQAIYWSAFVGAVRIIA
ncbi:MAG TPA: NlpC/P60 family protein [Streptosporangiaceae bacterium]|nr:NlpC/P60 family protein [Streptosporangiaceae bacterium]